MTWESKTHKVVNGVYRTDISRATFVGFFPADDPQVAMIVLPPLRQGAVAADACGVSMGPCLYGAPIITGGERDGVHAIHDALVMGCGAVWVCVGEVRSDDDAVAHSLA